MRGGILALISVRVQVGMEGDEGDGVLSLFSRDLMIDWSHGDGRLYQSWEKKKRRVDTTNHCCNSLSPSFLERNYGNEWINSSCAEHLHRSASIQFPLLIKQTALFILYFPVADKPPCDSVQ